MAVVAWLANFFANRVPEIMGRTMIGGIITAALATLLGGVYWHSKRVKEGKRGMDPSHVIAICLSGAALLMMVAAGAYIWQQFFLQKSQSAELMAATPTAVNATPSAEEIANATAPIRAELDNAKQQAASLQPQLDNAKQQAASLQSQLTAAIKERDDARLERDFLTPMAIGHETSSQPLNKMDEAIKLSIWEGVNTSNVNALTRAYNVIDGSLSQWLDRVKSGESKGLIYELGTGADAFMTAANDLEKLRVEYQKYQDVVDVLAPQPNRADFAKAINDLSNAVSSMPSVMMPPNYDTKLRPLAGALRRELATTLSWLQNLRRTAAEKQKELSSMK
jgi:hypothetical protein